MHDVQPRTSIGLRADYGRVFKRDYPKFFVSDLVLDGELAIGEHATVFATLPFGYSEQGVLVSPGFGNASVGALGAGAVGAFQLAGGAVLSSRFDRENPAESEINLEGNFASYAASPYVASAFVAGRRSWEASYVEVQLDYNHYTTAETNGRGELYDDPHDRVGAKVGGGVSMNGGPWFLAEVAWANELDAGPVANLSAQVGVRGGLGKTPGSWAARLGLSGYRGSAAFVSGELRVDWIR
jgi:hypothetical protein